CNTIIQKIHKAFEYFSIIIRLNIGDFCLNHVNLLLLFVVIEFINNDANVIRKIGMGQEKNVLTNFSLI
ncbi:MAG: hypothetical protein VYD14_05245, partial [SAR324 cluster bacterium]|nr:hypothetical protein [SAR324 cluster bacterium]